MKKFLIGIMMLPTLLHGVAMADSDRWVIGAALGTAAGLLIAHNSHHISPWVAAPVGGILGGYIAQRSGDWDRRHGYGPYAGAGYGYGYYAPPRQSEIVYVREQAAPPAAAPAVQTPDLHPGVDLIKVSILNSNGVRTDVPILRTGGKFVGPQGEEYDTLPTAAALAKRYGM